jgi:hypothetical protein
LVNVLQERVGELMDQNAFSLTQKWKCCMLTNLGIISNKYERWLPSFIILCDWLDLEDCLGACCGKEHRIICSDKSPWTDFVVP